MSGASSEKILNLKDLSVWFLLLF